MNANDWMEKVVKQVKPVVQDGTMMPGESKVIETMVDEKGNLHLHMENNWWCPARAMKTVPALWHKPVLGEWNKNLERCDENGDAFVSIDEYIQDMGYGNACVYRYSISLCPAYGRGIKVYYPTISRSFAETRKPSLEMIDEVKRAADKIWNGLPEYNPPKEK